MSNEDKLIVPVCGNEIFLLRGKELEQVCSSSNLTKHSHALTSFAHETRHERGDSNNSEE
jgi:hypothetical protein